MVAAWPPPAAPPCALEGFAGCGDFARGFVRTAGLLARVFAIDVTICRKCGGRMRILEVVSDPDDIARVLLGARAPPPPPRPHPPGQLLLFAC